jgi:hypothetical protein
MAEVDLVHPELTERISVVPLVTQCQQFIANPSLIGAPYHVKSAVSVDSFRSFVATLKGNAADITDGNHTPSREHQSLECCSESVNKQGFSAMLPWDWFTKLTVEHKMAKLKEINIRQSLNPTKQSTIKYYNRHSISCRVRPMTQGEKYSITNRLGIRSRSAIGRVSREGKNNVLRLSPYQGKQLTDALARTTRLID